MLQGWGEGSIVLASAMLFAYLTLKRAKERDKEMFFQLVLFSMTILLSISSLPGRKNYVLDLFFFPPLTLSCYSRPAFSVSSFNFSLNLINWVLIINS